MKKLVLKILLTLTIIFSVSSTIGFTNPTPASADCRYLLGLTSWDCNVNLNPANEEDLKSNIWIIIANIATDVSVVAAYLVIGYVIYGGYLYIFSSGDPGKVATGKKTLTQAFIGLAIVMLASVILNSIRIALGGANLLADCTITECIKPETMVIDLINWVIGIAGVVSVIFVIYGGVSYITSTGDPGKVQRAKEIILYALIGLAIVAFSATITAFVSNAIREAGDAESAIINNTTISKEVQ